MYQQFGTNGLIQRYNISAKALIIPKFATPLTGFEINF
jgi:hypothetical protein